MPLTSHSSDVVSRAPGKLYIAGEYAVVEPGHRAVLVAVDRFITVRIASCSPAGGYAGTISSRLYANGSRPWHHRPQDGQAEAVGGEDDYIISAIRVVEALVTQGGSARVWGAGASTCTSWPRRMSSAASSMTCTWTPPGASRE